MKNLIVGIMSLVFILGMIVFSCTFFYLQGQAAFGKVGIETYCVESFSRLFLFGVTLVGFISTADKLDVSGD